MNVSIEVSKHISSLTSHLEKWRGLTNNVKVLSWVKGYKIEFFQKPIQLVKPRQRTFAEIEQLELKAIILNLSSRKIIEISRAPYSKCFISPYFLATKSDGVNKRFILNLKQLNKFIYAPHFKLEDIRTALKLVSNGCFLAKIDLRDAYYAINIDHQSRKFLCFDFKGKIYQFTCLPFGLSIAPYIFTKIMKPIIAHLRKQGISCVIYLDDLLLLGKSREECQLAVTISTSLLSSLGFTVNLEKSSLNPSHFCTFLGFVLNSKNMTVELPMAKRKKLLSFLHKLLTKKSVTIRRFAEAIGILCAGCPAVKYGWLHVKPLERAKHLALIQSQGNYNSQYSFSEDVKDELVWWINNIFLIKNNIRQDRFDMEIFSDASRTGWGAVCGTSKFHGWWSNEELLHHINLLELKAAFLALKCFTKNKRDIAVLLRIDNTTAIAYINKMGGIRLPKLAKQAKEFWQWCETRNIWVSASYINTKDNWEADTESRRLPHETEGELTLEAFQLISRILGCPEIDLFATHNNFKCPKFVSWFPDPAAFAVDAFTIDWGTYYFYAFPPFSMILRTINKIISDHAEG